MRFPWIKSKTILAAIITGLFGLIGVILLLIFNSENSTIITKKSDSFNNKGVNINADRIESLIIANNDSSTPNKKVQPESKIYKRASKNDIKQEMNNSPNGVQVAGNINGDVNIDINTNRKIPVNLKDSLFIGLKNNPCQITIGVLGIGGEPTEFAEELYNIIKQADCQIKGPFHAVGFESFYGVRILYPPKNPPIKSDEIIERVFKLAKIQYRLIPEPKQQENSLYLYIGYKK
jgi:hypothetical protein